jgi:WD40 repeat protein
MVMEDSKYLLQCADNASKKPINSIDTFVSLDDEFLVAGSTDKNLRFIDTDSLEEIAKYTVDKKSVNCVCVSGIGLNGEDPVIVTGGKDSIIQIWNPVSGNLERTIELPTKEVKALAMYRGSETYIVVGTKDSRVLVWNFATNALEATYEGHKSSVYTVSITSSVDMSEIEGHNDLEGLCLASGSSDRTARTWSLRKGKKKKKFRHPWAVYTLVVSNTGPRPIMVCAGAAPSMQVWDAKAGVLLRSLEGHHHRVNHMALWEGFQMLLVTASADHTIRVYDVVTGECVSILVGHKDVVLRVAIAGVTPKIISSSDDMSLMQWDLNAIIEDHYFTEGNDIGLRKENVPPYIPQYDYVQPVGVNIDPRSSILQSQQSDAESVMSQRSDLESIIKATAAKAAAKKAKEDQERAEREQQQHQNQHQHQQQQRERESEKEDSVQPASPVDGLSSGPATDSAASVGTGKVAPADALPEGEVVVKAQSSSALRRASLTLVHSIMGVMKTHATKPVEDDESEEALRSKAKTTLSTFKVAQVEHELSAEKQRHEASEKLANRLQKKKMGEAAAAAAQAAAAVTAPSPQDELEAVKKEKLLQHKRQEQRSRQSMSLAKGRAADALQRRLEEMARRKAAANSVVEEQEGEDSDNSG